MTIFAVVYKIILKRHFMKNGIVVLLLFFIHYTIKAQTLVTDEGDNPVEGFGLVKDPNSNDVYFSRADSLLKTKIFKGTISDGKITAIKEVSILGKKCQEVAPFFSTDGKYFFIFSNAASPKTGNLDLWFGKYKNGLISEMVAGVAINSDSVECYGSISESGNMYFSSWRKSGNGKGDIYTSKFKNGSFSSISHIENNINNIHNNFSPAVAPNENWMIYSTENADKISDLHVSFAKGSKWSKPIKLSNKVNTSSLESAPVIADDGKTLYFSRTEKLNSSSKAVFHMYKISVEELELDKLKVKALY